MMAISRWIRTSLFSLRSLSRALSFCGLHSFSSIPFVLCSAANVRGIILHAHYPKQAPLSLHHDWPVAAGAVCPTLSPVRESMANLTLPMLPAPTVLFKWYGPTARRVLDAAP